MLFCYRQRSAVIVARTRLPRSDGEAGVGDSSCAEDKEITSDFRLAQSCSVGQKGKRTGREGGERDAFTSGWHAAGVVYVFGELAEWGEWYFNF